MQMLGRQAQYVYYFKYFANPSRLNSACLDVREKNQSSFPLNLFPPCMTIGQCCCMKGSLEDRNTYFTINPLYAICGLAGVVHTYYIGDLSNSFCCLTKMRLHDLLRQKKTFLTYYMLHDLFGEKTHFSRRQVFSKQVSCYHLGGRKVSDGEYI